MTWRDYGKRRRARPGPSGKAKYRPWSEYAKDMSRSIEYNIRYEGRYVTQNVVDRHSGFTYDVHPSQGTTTYCGFWPFRRAAIGAGEQGEATARIAI
jgi:hypothetical protein